MQNSANEERTDVIERALGLDIGPGLPRERVLQAVDDTLDRIEEILLEMDRRPSPHVVRTEREAFRSFMAALRVPLARQGSRVSVSETSGFVKMTSTVNGHRVYVSKGKLRVGRVESTLPPELVPGAVVPTHCNGRIASWIPPDVPSVERAIEVLGTRGIRPL